MSFLIGVLIGGGIVYFWLQNKLQEAQRVEQTLRKQLAESENEAHARVSQTEDAQRLEAQVATGQAKLQTKMQELQQMTEQLSTAETRISSLQEQLAVAESRAAEAKERTVAEVPKKESAFVQSDNLTKIEGIGPKVSQVLSGSGIHTFAQLAATEAGRLREILQEAGPRFKMMEPESWPEQAGLAAKGAWDDLSKLQDELDGGKYRR